MYNLYGYVYNLYDYVYNLYDYVYNLCDYVYNLYDYVYNLVSSKTINHCQVGLQISWYFVVLYVWGLARLMLCVVTQH